MINDARTHKGTDIGEPFFMKLNPQPTTILGVVGK